MAGTERVSYRGHYLILCFDGTGVNLTKVSFSLMRQVLNARGRTV